MITCNYNVCYATYAEAYINAQKITPKGIVIHSTGAENPDLKRWVNDTANCGENPNKNYFCGENDKRKVLPHAVFGYDKNKKFAIENILPYDYRCWGCGSGENGSYNTSHIQIEIAEDYGLPKDYLDIAIKCVAEWCARLMHKYKDITINNIVSHKEAAAAGFASNHGDPEHWLSKYGYTMDNFRSLVADWYNRLEETEHSPADKLDIPKKLFRVQLGAFSTYDNAKAYVKHLREDYGLEAFVVIPK